ncbi:hypothetical protein [Bartonella phoceensis]|uniref:hypothetical protein n=1 Tax=Bartonella phoceensis TaxID=270249 RepID=UPI001ABA2A0A|nr:hypothetical protein [Bartonella phoceensis]
MKKLYTKLAGSDLKFSRFPFIKVVSLSSIAALLSSISSVFSKNLVSREEASNIIRSVAVEYPQSVISVYDDSTSYLELMNVFKDNYRAVLSRALTSEVHILNGSIQQ